MPRVLGILVVAASLSCAPASSHEPSPDALETLVETLRGRLTRGEQGDILALDLFNTDVTDADLAHPKGLTALEHLGLEDTQVGDAGLAHLEGLSALVGLCLEDTQVTDAGVAELQKALPYCSVSR